MFTKLIYLFIFASQITESPIFAAVAKEVVNYCSPTEFPCGDGGCVSAELVCDGARDCADGLDEVSCGESPITLLSQESRLHRYRRQASRCRRNQWQCRDGSCISFDGKCDGIVDCADSSDETHALCRNNVCQNNWFRCTYGACVDGTAPCNGNQECADNSDELLPRCRNETDEVRGTFKCVDGSKIPASSHCDGTRDCPDGSDETVRSCAAKSCPSYLFQCAYGACVNSDANCNQIQDCADGSDETAELCDKSGTAPVTPIKPPAGNCVLPSRPDHGNYVTNIPNGKPGEAYQFLVINITCQQGYGVVGSRSISCYNGYWPETMPKCVSLCHLMPHPSVEYNCQVTEGGVTGTRICKEYEPHGTVVIPRCQTPNYYSPTELQFMQCIQGIWDYVAICIPGLTRNGTNITILIKDTVEVHVSDIQYVVPINHSYVMPVVPITDIDYSVFRPIRPNKPVTDKPIFIPNNGTSSDDDNNNGIDKFSEIHEATTSKLYDNSGNINNNNKRNQDTESKSDELNSEIELWDWRMGVPDNYNNKIPSITNDNKKRKNNNAYRTLNNFANTVVYHNKKPIDKKFSIDARFGDSDNQYSTGNQYSSKSSIETTTSSPKGSEVKLYTSKNNNTKIYFNISNSHVNVHADGDVVFQNN